MLLSNINIAIVKKMLIEPIINTPPLYNVRQQKFLLFYPINPIIPNMKTKNPITIYNAAP